MENAGVVGGNEVFKDRETGSRWQQSSLEAISGPLRGTHLSLYPFLLTSWEEWRRLHPDTLVLKPLPGYADRIAVKNEQIRQGLSGEGAAPSDVTYRDDRLKPKTMVLGLDVDGAAGRPVSGRAAKPKDVVPGPGWGGGEPRLSAHGAAHGEGCQRAARRQAGRDRPSAGLGHDDGVRGARAR